MTTTWKTNARVLTTAAATALLTLPAFAADEVTSGTEYSPKSENISDSRTASDVMDETMGENVTSGTVVSPADENISDGRTASDVKDMKKNVEQDVTQGTVVNPEDDDRISDSSRAASDVQD